MCVYSFLLTHFLLLRRAKHSQFPECFQSSACSAGSSTRRFLVGGLLSLSLVHREGVPCSLFWVILPHGQCLL